MLKRSFFLSMAAGVVASLALGAPSQAGSVLVETDAAVTATNGMGSGDIEVTYSSAPTGPITILGTTTVSVTSTGIVGDTVTINYTPVKGDQEVDFTLYASPSVTILAAKVTGGFDGSPHSKLGVVTSVYPSAVPEPSSMALLGIGMTGFLAFRRLFKRTSVA